jgi:hypothetical protein
MNLPEQPDLLIEAQRMRDEGMRLALEHAELIEDHWGEIAYAFLVAYAQRTSLFISEDVSDASKADTAFPQPPTDRAWGSIYKRAIRAGIIVQAGAGRSRRRHASICPLWRSTLFPSR